MAMKRMFLTACLMFVPALAMWAQLTYATVELQEIGEKLARRGCTLSSPGTFPMPSGTSFGFYELRMDEQGNVCHLGIPILNRELYNNNPSPIYDFIERYFLHMSLLTEKERKQYMESDHVMIDFSQIRQIDVSTSFQMASDEKGFQLIWEKDGKNVCKMTFPKNIQLISGKNKKEIERDFLKGLNLMQGYMENINIPQESNVSLSTDSAYYIYKGNYYILKEINSDTYFVKDENSRLIPLYDTKYPSETISNLFNSLLTGEYKLQITQRMYGKEKITYEVFYHKLYNYCIHMGCQPYIGIESVDDKCVKAIVVYENDLYGYNHLLYVDVDLNVLRNKDGVINAELYCYIPTYNLKSLFQPNELKDYEN